MARIFFCCSQITFKATAKGKGKLAVTAFGDLWLHATAFLILAVSIGIGIWQLIDGAAVLSPLLISILWAAYSIIPPFLLLLYSFTGHNMVMQFFCKCAAPFPNPNMGPGLRGAHVRRCCTRTGACLNVEPCG